MPLAGSITVRDNGFAFGGDSVINAAESEGFALHGVWRTGTNPLKSLSPGDTVSVKFGNVVVGTTTHLIDGTWTFSLPPGDTLLNHGVADGSFVVSVSATHLLHTASTSATATVDTGAAVPTIALVTDSGVSGFDRKTNDATLTGTAEAGATVTVVPSRIVWKLPGGSSPAW